MFPPWRHNRGNEEGADLSFACRLDGETWKARVLWTVHHGSHVEFAVENRGRRFTCVIGPSGEGYFLALPDHHLCLTLQELKIPPDLGDSPSCCSHFSRHDRAACLLAVQALAQRDALF